MITAASNQRIKNLVNLIQKAKARREQDVFITEGVKMFLEAETDKIMEVYVSESFYEKGTAREKIEQCNYEILSDELFKKVSDTHKVPTFPSLLQVYLKSCILVCHAYEHNEGICTVLPL